MILYRCYNSHTWIPTLDMQEDELSYSLWVMYMNYFNDATFIQNDKCIKTSDDINLCWKWNLELGDM